VQELGGGTARQPARAGHGNIPHGGQHAQFIGEDWPGARNPLFSMSWEFGLFCGFGLFFGSSAKSEFCVLPSLLGDWLRSWLSGSEKKKLYVTIIVF